MVSFSVDILKSMRNVIIAGIVFIALALLAVFWYFFGATIISLFNNASVIEVAPNFTQEEIQTTQTKEEQREILEELAPEDPVDTQIEIDAQVELLKQLQAL